MESVGYNRSNKTIGSVDLMNLMVLIIQSISICCLIFYIDSLHIWLTNSLVGCIFKCIGD